MGRIQKPTSSTSSSAMDIDPRSSSWNTLCPNFLEKRNRIHLEDDSNGHVIGSPPPSGAPKVMWDDNAFKEELASANPHAAEGASVSTGKETVDASELTLRVQDIRLQPPQPMIICETVDDEKDENREMACGDAVSLAVPPVDVSNEKKRPPMSAPF